MSKNKFDKLSGPPFLISFSREMLAVLFAAYDLDAWGLSELIGVSLDDAQRMIDGHLPDYAAKNKLGELLGLQWIHADHADNLVQFTPRSLSIVRRGRGFKKRPALVESVSLSSHYLRFLEEGRRTEISTDAMRELGSVLSVQFLIL